MDEPDEIEAGYVEAIVAPNFSAGEVARLTFSVFGKNPLLYLALAFFAGVPEMLIAISFPTKAGERVGYIADSLFSVIFMGAIAYGVYKGLIGERAGIGEAVRRGLSRYWSLIGLVFLFGIFLFFLVSAGVLFMAVAGKILGVIVLLIAVFACLYAFCAFAVITPACVVERLSAMGSINRSGALTKGHRGAVFGLFFLSVLGAIVVKLPIRFLFSPAGIGFGVAQRIADIFIVAIAQVGVSVLYYQLRAAKEGVSVSSLARVFE